MKHKISAIFLSVTLCLSCLCVCAVPARAAGSAAGLDIAIELYYNLLKQIIEDNEDFNEWKSFNATTPEGFKARSIVLTEFKPLKEYLPNVESKEEFLHILTLFVNTDNAAVINEEYGRDAELLYREHNLEFNDFYVNCIIPLFVGLEDFVNALYETDLTDYSVDDKGNVQIPVEDFKQELEKQNNTIDPKNRSMLKYSWRDLSNNQDNVNLNCFARGIFADGKSVVGTTLEEGIYIQVYMRRNGYMYYAPYQYKLYFEKESLGGHSPVYQYTWYLEPIYYERLDGVSLDTFKAVGIQFSDYVDSNGKVTSCDMSKYVSLGLNSYNDYWGFELKGYTSLAGCQKNLDDDVVKRYSETSGAWYSSIGLNAGGDDFSSLHASERKYLLRSDDISDKYMFGKWSARENGTSSDKFGITHFFRHKSYSDANFINYSINTHDTGIKNGTVDSNVYTCTENNTCDFGFLISSEEFSTTYKFDTTRLPVNSTVTISGDSVYDYSITDNSTGETSTIYNYVTNNYNYPENSGGNTSGGNGGGTVGGNITVGGQVDVGGKVDINVNVNGNGNGVSADMPDMNAVDDYLNSALDESTGIRKLLKEFFGFLPDALVVLLGTGLAAAIVARIFGR